MGGDEKTNLRERLLDYAVRIIKLVEALPKTIAGKRIGDQLLRSGTGGGANYEEAQAGESRADFVHKLQIALKEIRESHYWLRLLAKAQVLPCERFGDILDESAQLIAILSKSVATAKKRSRSLALLPFAFCLLRLAF